MTTRGAGATPAYQRARVPKWVARLGRAGVPEALAALLIMVYNELFPNLSEPRTAPVVLVDIWLCIFAGITGRWPRVGTIGVGIGLLLSVLLRLSPSITVLTLFIPVVSNAAHGRRSLRDPAALTYLAAALVWTIPQSNTAGDVVQTLIIWAVLIGVSWLSGHTIHRLRSEGERQASLRTDALRSQRRSIARDLHDTVSYATATMIMRAEQIKLRSTDPELIADLDFIITTGRRSVRDLRGMMETLRRNDPDLESAAPPPRDAPTLTDVVRRQQAVLAGHGLTLQTGIEDDLDSLPNSVREATSKLIVEATTNMVKYASRGACQLIIEVHDGHVEAVFTNQIRPAGHPGEAAGLGLGLVGAAERVHALGGELESGAVGGTWILRATLPVGG